MMLKRIKKKLQSAGGFSLTEMLVATIILLIAAQGMTDGISFASSQYTKQMRNSQSRILCSTLENTINYEFAHTDKIVYSNKSGSGTYAVSKFFSPTFCIRDSYSQFVAIDDSGKPVASGIGYLVLGYQPSEGTYDGYPIASESLYTYGIKASVDNVVYVERDNAPSYFQYRIKIYDESGNTLIEDLPQIIPVDEKSINFTPE